MKKYFFILSICAIFATVACDTSSQATTTQMATAPQTSPAPTALAAPQQDSAMSNQQMKKAYSGKAKTMEMAAPQKMTVEQAAKKQQ
jgi:hypothetical protein